MEESISIYSLPATSTITKRKFISLGINTYWDLINYFPFRYEDYSLVSTIDRVQTGEIVTIKGQIIDGKFQISRRGTKIQKFILQDETGKMDLIWYNQPYLLQLLKPKTIIAVAGEIKQFGRKRLMEPTEYELLGNNSDVSIHQNQKTIHTGRIIPVYPEKKGLSNKTIRQKIYYVIDALGLFSDQLAKNDSIKELLPGEIIRYNDLINEHSAYQNIHFPINMQMAKKARDRLAFDELFTIQLASNLIKKEWQNDQVTNSFKTTPFSDKINQFIANLPFQLTRSQEKSIREIYSDLNKTSPMNRLLQGDVGSGKTVVAATSCYLAYLNGYQSLFMAPTEILANQHYQTLTGLFKDYPLKIGLQTRSQKISKKSILIKDYHIIIGTHALLNEKLSYDKIGLVIIDEQHRFGVLQRSLLKEKGINPHLLTMTATPIPRTVALTLFNELDLSFIDEMPKGRIPIKTYLISQEKRAAGYQWINKQIIENGVQVFIICPLIEESDKETLTSVKAAKKEYQRLQQEIFPRLKIGLLHGRLKPKEKNKIMNDFKDKKYNILVSTSLVEVGIDIANATIMLIEGAERFGLAQLHQLRGRVGRGDKQSFCFLFTEKEDQFIISRLKFFCENVSGMALAEYDLKNRGPGNIYGTRQHGYLDLKAASLFDFDMINKSKNAVHYFINKYHTLEPFSEIKKRVEEYKTKQIARD